MSGMLNHHLRLAHHRDNMAITLDMPSASGVVEINTDSTDLTEAVRELLSRMPNDLYAAFKNALADARH